MTDDPIHAALTAAAEAGHEAALSQAVCMAGPEAERPIAAATITAFLRAIPLASIRDRYGVDAAIWHGIMTQDVERAAKEACDG